MSVGILDLLLVRASVTYLDAGPSDPPIPHNQRNAHSDTGLRLKGEGLGCHLRNVSRREDVMSESFSRRVVVPESVLVRELSGEAVLLNLESEMYFGLDEIGYRMWTALTTSDSIGAAYEQLLSEYEVEPEQLRESVDELINQCTEQGLLQLVSSK
jgi:Coenzyme PQQ synthesis protein D (PqqD)